MLRRTFLALLGAVGLAPFKPLELEHGVVESEFFETWWPQSQWTENIGDLRRYTMIYGHIPIPMNWAKANPQVEVIEWID